MKEKSCQNCIDYIVCLQEMLSQEAETKKTPKLCSHWKLDLKEFEELFKGKDLLKMTDKQIDKYINENYQ